MISLASHGQNEIGSEFVAADVIVQNLGIDGHLFVFLGRRGSGLAALGRLVAPVLMENQVGHFALAVHFEGQLRIHNPQEEVLLGFAEHLELCLPGQLREEPIAIQRHGDEGAWRQFIGADILRQDFMRHLNFLAL